MEATLTGEWTRILAYLGVATVMFSAVIGAIAAISPRVFEKLIRIADKRFSLDGVIAVIERPIDVERYLKPHTRLMGIAVLTCAICVSPELIALI